MGNNKNLDALMGRAKASETQKKFSTTIDTLNEIIVIYPKFIPAQIEKARVIKKYSKYLITINSI